LFRPIAGSLCLLLLAGCRFAVVPPDTHGFDADGDGIGCESD